MPGPGELKNFSMVLGFAIKNVSIIKSISVQAYLVYRETK